jgi:hypothetical protein
VVFDTRPDRAIAHDSLSTGAVLLLFEQQAEEKRTQRYEAFYKAFRIETTPKAKWLNALELISNIG